MTDTDSVAREARVQTRGDADEKLVRTAYERLGVWKRGCDEMHERARMARKIFLLQDPLQDEPGSGGKTLQLQTLKATIMSCIADQMDNMPEVRLLPERSELTDTSEALTDVVRFVLEQNRYESLHRKRVEDFFVAGTSVTQIVWDDDMDAGRGNVALLRWPVEAFLWDPQAEDVQDARALFKISWHPLTWYRAHYPDKACYILPEDRRFGDIGVPDSWEMLAGDEERAMLLEYWYRTFDAKTGKHRINVAFIAGGALLDKCENVYAHGRYPFVVDAFSRIDGMPAGEGMAMELAPMMRYINRYARYIDENLRMSAKIRMLVRKNANIDVDALADWNENLISGDSIDEESVRWLQSKPLSPMAANQMLQFQIDVKQDSGQNQFTRGETAGGVTAASAISALQEAGGKISRLRTACLNQGFREIAEQILWLVSQFYEGDRTYLITGRDGDARAVPFDAAYLMGDLPDVSREAAQLPEPLRVKLEARLAQKRAARGIGELPPPPYSVQICVQKRNPLRVQAQNEMFMQAYTLANEAGKPLPLSALFEMMDFDGKERVQSVLRGQEARERTLAELGQNVDELSGVAEQNRRMRIETEGLRDLIARFSK